MAKKSRRSRRQHEDSNGFLHFDKNEDGNRIRKTFHTKDLRSIQPQKQVQRSLFEFYQTNPQTSLWLYGSPGTGKTFLSMYLALRDILSKESPYDNLLIVRSVVPSREIGHLPGDINEKIQVYEEPYMSICDELFEYKKSYENMKEKGLVRFAPTSFLRGTTFDNTIILVDETQNMTFQELDTIITRVGSNAKIIFSGDMKQSDLLYKRYDSSGFVDFAEVIKRMPTYFKCIEFKPEDIVRSGLVKEYILQKQQVAE